MECFLSESDELQFRSQGREVESLTHPVSTFALFPSILLPGTSGRKQEHGVSISLYLKQREKRQMRSLIKPSTFQGKI